MAETIYPQGLKAFEPRKGAPEYVKADIVITVDEFIQWLKNNDKLFSEYKGNAQLRCQMKEGKSGLYISVDTWKPQEAKQEAQKPVEKADAKPVDDDLPF